MASNFGWIVRLCTTVLRHWRWTCRHHHQKHYYVERIFSLRNAYSWKKKSAEEELEDACFPEAEQEYLKLHADSAVTD